MDDNEIIALYQQRCEDAITETDIKYGLWCRSIAQRIVGIMEDAEECVSDAYLKLWNTIPPEVPRSLGAYVGRIVRNLSISRYRQENAQRRGGSQVPLALDELAECIPGTSTVEDMAENRELVEALNGFLGTLSREERNIFLRRYWHLSSVKEIAKLYGYSESRITSQLFRTRKKLKQYLMKEGIDL